MIMKKQVESMPWPEWLPALAVAHNPGISVRFPVSLGAVPLT
jgi:hypothetical protein